VQSRRGRRKREKKAKEAYGTTATTARNIQAARTTIVRGSRKRTPGLCSNTPITRILFRSNAITNSGATGTRGINSRALVRHERSRLAGRSRRNARRILHRRGSSGHKELPERSAGGNKHGRHDGAQIGEKKKKKIKHDGMKELF
jgi:hypothetical protein